MGVAAAGGIMGGGGGAPAAAGMGSDLGGAGVGGYGPWEGALRPGRRLPDVSPLGPWGQGGERGGG